MAENKTTNAYEKVEYRLQCLAEKAADVAQHIDHGEKVRLGDKTYTREELLDYMVTMGGMHDIDTPEGIKGAEESLLTYLSYAQPLGLSYALKVQAECALVF